MELSELQDLAVEAFETGYRKKLSKHLILVIRERVKESSEKSEKPMRLKAIKEIKTKAEAQQIAIDWQEWQSTRSLSYGELSKYQAYFETLAKKFRLKKEFKENGII